MSSYWFDDRRDRERAESEEPLLEPEPDYCRERIVILTDSTMWRVTLYRTWWGELYTSRVPLIPIACDNEIPF